MKKLLLGLLMLPALLNAQNDLFFSEYSEGSSNNKYLEIYNSTELTVDLSNYSVEVYSNGATTATNTLTWPVGTFLHPDSVYVIYNGSSNATIVSAGDISSSVTFFNGDDALALLKMGTIIDVIGQIGVDPGTFWTVGTGSTLNYTLVRNPDICSGNPTDLGSFAAPEWTVLPMDDWSNIGQHTSNCFGSCNTYSFIEETTCGTYTVPSGDESYSATGLYSDTISNTALCDSIISIYVVIAPTYSGITDAATICAGDSYDFGTQTLTSTGDYIETFSTIDGCDSTVTLSLTVVSSYNENISATICNGETYTLGTQTLTLEGNYSELFTSSSGCDSTVNLDLTVLPVPTFAFSENACESYTTPSGLYTYSTSGIYNDTLTAANGCDSILTITLTINSSDLITETATACNSFDFEGNTYTSSGIYDVIYTNINGCDSIRQLDLTINNSPMAPETNGDQTLCEGNTPLDLTASANSGAPLIISGIWDGPITGGLPKGFELYAMDDIADLSIYGYANVVNGGGSAGTQEVALPAVTLTAGEYFYVATDSTQFFNFFGFYPQWKDATNANNNGDDAVELYMDGTIIDVFGDVNNDGTGTEWDYVDGWAYRNTNATTNNGIWSTSDWTFSGTNQLEGGITNGTCTSPVPVGTFTSTPASPTFTWYEESGLSTILSTDAIYATGQTTGTEDYYVTATLNGCESDASMVSVTFNAVPNVNTIVDQTLCLDETTEPISFSGSGPSTTFNWTNDNTSLGLAASGSGDIAAFTPIATGTSVIVVTPIASGCEGSTKTFTITVNDLPSVTLAPFTDMCVNHAAITLSSGLPAGGSYTVEGTTATTFDPSTGAGTYTVVYSYTDGITGCTNSATEDIYVDACIGIEENNSSVLSIYPNPVKEQLNIIYEGGTYSLSIFDMTGTVVFEGTNTTKIDVSKFARGSYILQMNTSQGVEMKKFIKN